ncbi:MAG: SCO family protein [Janthinobacterium lividum]
MLSYRVWRTLFVTLTAVLLSVSFSACSSNDTKWGLTDITGHLPDLKFSLVADDGHPVTAEAYRGKIALVYFGYTHCPDVCPTTLAHLTDVLRRMGSDARDVRILFISVDPQRDTPPVMHAYVDAFDAEHAVGLTGNDAAIEALAKRYRVAYEAAKADPSGAYEVTHSSAIYIFDKTGRARLLGSSTDTAENMMHDLRRLARS